MNWSYSQAKQFQRCPRQWYYKTHVANARAKDSVRREAFLLSKVDSLWAWRGKIVDMALSVRLIPQLRQKRLPREAEIQNYAHHLYSTQLKYAQEHGIRNKDVVISKIVHQFAALSDIESGQGISLVELEQARSDIERSIHHLMTNEELLTTLMDAQQLVAQRPLQFDLNSLSGQNLHVTATPDVIVFRKQQRPLIIDWKVKFFSKNDAEEQLRVYGLALQLTRRHADFPVQQNPFQVSQQGFQGVDLMEYQLLDNIIRNYELTSEDLPLIEDYIQASANRMADIAEDIQNMNMDELPVARYPETCEACTFKPLCWEETHVTP